MKRVLSIALMGLLGLATLQAWPIYDAPYILRIEKKAGMEIDQIFWMHLHDMPTMPEAATVTVFTRILERQGRPDIDPNLFPGLELRYTVKDNPVTPWLANRTQSFETTIAATNPALPLKDMLTDMSVEIRGADINLFKPHRAFVHLARGREYDMSVPIIQHNQEDVDIFGPNITYVHPSQRLWRGYPADPTVAPFHSVPYEADLYLEPLGPSTSLFNSLEMWWAQAGQPHRDMPFVRAIAPKHGEDHRSLRVQWRHERLPMKDGPRGVAWMSAYVSGQMLSNGDFIFAEVGGRVGKLTASGEIHTFAGRRVKLDKDPIWYEKPTSVVHQNMENVGVWESGSGEFRTPLDVTADPQDTRILYVAAYEDQCIYRVDTRQNPAVISVFAGSESRQSGYVNGTGNTARFNGPATLIFDPIADVLYVGDQDNDAIRVITRNRVVTTLVGNPGMQSRINGNDYDQLNARAQSRFTVSSAEAASGLRPDIYLPQALRVDSTGRLILLEIGYGAIRRINPVTFVTEKLAEVQQKHTDGDRGWAWLDVDRWGNSGPKDGVYWCKFVGEFIDGEPNERRFNEVYAWVPPNGGGSQFVFERDWPDSPVGVGRRDFTIAPHYPWLIVVDPRGGLLLAGAGQHGIMRLRVRRPTDPLPPSQTFAAGRNVWMGITNPSELMFQHMKYGYNGHNNLGFADAWGMRDYTDEQILNAFEIPSSIRNNTTWRNQLLINLRINAGPPAPTVTPFQEPSNRVGAQ